MRLRRNIVSGIYCIENTINHKKYIGQSVNVYDRWCKHRVKLNQNTHDNDYLQKSWNKYGEDTFKFTLLEECSIDDLDEKETYYINLYNTLNRDYGYNLKTGGQLGGAIVSDYVRNKMSKAIKKSYQNNEYLSEEHRKMALKQWSNPEIKAKILGENNGMYGKHHSEEARKKISEARKGVSPSTKNIIPVLCLELNKIFSSATEAAKELNLKSHLILQVCYGNRHTHGNYHWKFVTENNI